jgi:peptidoglycan/LPS O-acetylase OafA/YrhL
VSATPDTICTGARLPELDALRGLSALAVGLYHLTYFAPFVLPGVHRSSVPIWWGCYGVQVFFAISGFVILGSLDRKRGLGSFCRARAARISPEYWVAMIITACVTALLGPPKLRVDLSAWIANLPLLQLWTGVKMIDSVYWSLNVEIIFYAAMALAWRCGWTRRIEMVVLAWLVVKWLVWACPVLPAGIEQLLMVQHAPYFAVGLVTYRIWAGQRRVTEQLPILTACAVTVWLLDPIHAHWLFAAMVPLFLLLAGNRLRTLGHPVLLWMGRMSYPFYLLHGAIGYSVIYQLSAAGWGPDTAAVAALVTGGLLAMGLEHLVRAGKQASSGLMDRPTKIALA